MAYVKQRTISWNLPDDNTTTGSFLYWGDPDVPFNQDPKLGPVSARIDVGMATVVHVPADPDEPNHHLEDLWAGDIKIGIAVYDAAGNEAEILEGTSFFDLTPPLAPTNLVID